MSLHVIETGEIVEEMSRVEAERITSRIADKLDTIADNLEQVLPLIGEALTREAWKVLGYSSPTAYVSERFAGALTRLPVEVRRPVVVQLSAAGMSTRAIAPIVGKDQSVITRDIQASKQVMQSASPKPERETGMFQTGAAWVESGEEIPLETETTYDKETYEVLDEAPLPKSEKIIGADGKQYQRPERTEHAPRPDSLTKQFSGAVSELNRVLDKFYRIRGNKNFDRNKEQVATLHGSDLNRAISELQELADALN